MSMDVPFGDARYLTIATSLTAGRAVICRGPLPLRRVTAWPLPRVLDDQPGLARAHRL
jgi:hypothetical protein